MPTTYGNDIVYCLKSHCGVRGYCRQKWVLQVQIICKFSNERTCKRNKDVQGLSCGFEVYYKKGTLERKRKDHLKGVIKDFEEHNAKYAELQKNLRHIDDCIVSKETKSTEYDNTITSVFNRISDIMNDLIKKIDNSQSLSEINLSDLKVMKDSISIADN